MTLATSDYLNREPISLDAARRKRIAASERAYREARRRFETSPSLFTATDYVDTFSAWLKWWPRLHEEDRAGLVAKKWDAIVRVLSQALDLVSA